MGRPLSLGLYRGATSLIGLAVPAILRGRVKTGKEDAARLGERLGHASRSRPTGPLVWLHGASVGETVSLLPLVERLRATRPDVSVLVTSGTMTSADLLARRLPPGAFHQYIPVDTPGAAARFLDHWKPDLAVFVESELWPNLLLGAKARGVTLALVSARMTEGSAKGWRRFPAAARAVLRTFDLVLPQDVRTGVRLKDLGALVDGYANLKLVGEALRVLARAHEHQRAFVAGEQQQVDEHRVVLACADLQRDVLDVAVTLADGGADTVDNTMALCPTCHRRAHHAIDREAFSKQLRTQLVRERQAGSAPPSAPDQGR